MVFCVPALFWKHACIVIFVNDFEARLTAILVMISLEVPSVRIRTSVRHFFYFITLEFKTVKTVAYKN